MIPIKLTLECYGRRVSSASTIFTLTFTKEEIQELRTDATAYLEYGYTLYRVPGMLRMMDRDSKLSFTFSPSEGLTLYKFGSPYFPLDKVRIQRLEEMNASMEMVWRETFVGFNPPISRNLPPVKSFEFRGLSFSLKRFGPSEIGQVLDNDALGIPKKDGHVKCIINVFDYIEENQRGFSLRFKLGADWESPEKRFEFTVGVKNNRELDYYGCSEELASEIAGFLL
jgi:hypothetical protein